MFSCYINPLKKYIFKVYFKNVLEQIRVQTDKSINTLYRCNGNAQAFMLYFYVSI